MKKLAVLLAAVLAVAALAGCSGGGVEKTMSLYVLNWGDYIDDAMLEAFRQEYPYIDLHYDTMTSNEEMVIRLQSADSIYDLCFPSDYIITKLIKEDLLAEIDTARLTNYGNLDPRFLHLEFDPENEYSVPYHWGTVGILYNTAMVDEPVDSWDVLWNEKYADQIYMYDSVRDSMMVALTKLGYSGNTTDAGQIAEAEALLKRQKPLVAVLWDRRPARPHDRRQRRPGRDLQRGRLRSHHREPRSRLLCAGRGQQHLVRQYGDPQIQQEQGRGLPVYRLSPSGGSRGGQRGLHRLFDPERRGHGTAGRRNG